MAKKTTKTSPKTKIKKIAILASGGNSPGMNNCVITVVKHAIANKITPYIIYDGYKGLLEEKISLADLNFLENFNSRGNIIIGSARSKNFYDPKVKEQAAKILKKHKIDVLYVIGGDGSYMGAYGLSKFGIKVLCLPGTIDNDISSTEQTIGFFTCLNQIVKAVDAIRDSFESHNGICICEVMGRGYSDLALFAGIATECEAIISKDNIFTKDDFVKVIKQTEKNNKRSCIFLVTEKLYGADGLPTLNEISNYIQEKTGRLCRVNVIGGGDTDAWDRVNASLMATKAFECMMNNKLNRVISIISGEIVDIDIKKATQTPRKKSKTYLLSQYHKTSIF